MSEFLDEMKRKEDRPTLESFFKKSPRFHNIPSQLYQSRKWRALTELLSNPWFERLWVVQEVVMAPDETSSTGPVEDSIILSFESCSITFEMFARVVQKIWDDHLHTELTYSHQDENTTDQLLQYPPVGLFIAYSSQFESFLAALKAFGLRYNANFGDLRVFRPAFL